MYCQQTWDFVYNKKLFVSQLRIWYFMIKKMITIEVGRENVGTFRIVCIAELCVICFNL